jgi:hypothetical protein
METKYNTIHDLHVTTKHHRDNKKYWKSREGRKVHVARPNFWLLLSYTNSLPPPP